MSTTTHELDAATGRRIEEARERWASRQGLRERLVMLLFIVGFLTGASALALFAHPARELSIPLALAFVASMAVAARIEFSVGAGSAMPTQLVFVPMLLLLPTPLVPLLVAVALVVSSAIAQLRTGVALSRALNGVADALFSLCPALIIVALGAQLPAWEHLPVYALAFVAQVIVDDVIYVARVRMSLGLPFRKLVSDLGLSERVDLLLSPLGLLAAIAAAGAPAAGLLVVALFPLLIGFEREREGRIQHSLELGRAYRGTALLLRDLLEDDDEYTGHHTEDVVELSVRVAEEMGVDEDTLRATEMGALLHDIGKIAVPDEIINKPGPLDDDEWAIMKTHTVEGERMLQQVGGLLSSVGVVVRASHERWDGRGYPDGLVADAIPVAARIISACDAFNAMTTDRSYRKALPLDVALGELHKHSGSQFAPDVVTTLVAVVTRDQPDWQLRISEPAPSRVEAQPQPVQQA